MVKSLIHFELILYMVWAEGPVSFFCMWVSSFPSTIYWKDYLFQCCVFLAPLWKIVHGASLRQLFWTIRQLIDLHLFRFMFRLRQCDIPWFFVCLIALLWCLCVGRNSTCSSLYGRILQISPVRDSGASQTCSVHAQAPHPSLLGRGFRAVCLRRVPPSPGGVQGTARAGGGLHFPPPEGEVSGSALLPILPGSAGYSSACPSLPSLLPRRGPAASGSEWGERPGAWGCGCSFSPSGLGRRAGPLSAEGTSLGEGGAGGGSCSSYPF